MRPESDIPAAIAEQAAVWVGRRDAGLTVAESAELDAWSAADPRHAAAVARFEAVWAAADRPRTYGVGDVIRRNLAERALVRRRRRRRVLAGAAFAMCLAFGVAKVATESTPRPASDVAAAVPLATFLGPVRQILPDGSSAEFPAGTKLDLEFGPTARRVSFVGTAAHFEVTHDTTRPFVVTAGGLAVRAVGTAFAIQVSDDKTVVLVSEGRVAVNVGAAPSSTPPLGFVDAGQSMDLTPGTAPVVETLGLARLAERLPWRYRRVEFSNAPLSEVVALVNRHNQIQFSIADSALARVPLSGVFRLDAPDELAALLETSFGLTVDRTTPDRLLLRRRS